MTDTSDTERADQQTVGRLYTNRPPRGRPARVSLASYPCPRCGTTVWLTDGVHWWRDCAACNPALASAKAVQAVGPADGPDVQGG